MEPEIILHMKKLSLQDQNLNNFDEEIELNRKRYSEQFFSSNVKSTNELIIHLKRVSVESQREFNKNELYGSSKVQMVENFNNLQNIQNKDSTKDSVIEEKTPQTIIKDIVEQNGPHPITVGNFICQIFENKDLHYINNEDPLLATTSGRSGSVKSNATSQSKDETKIHRKVININKVEKPMSIIHNKRKQDVFDCLTPRTWDSWTSSTLSSLPTKSLNYFFNFKDNYNIPWKKLIGKQKHEIEKVTSIYRFDEVFEPRHGTRYGTQRKFHSEVIKNTQWPSNDFFTCLLCDKPGHFCHECQFYNQFTFQHDHLLSTTLLNVIKDTDYDIKNTNISFYDKTNRPLNLINDTHSKLFSRANQNEQKKTLLHTSPIPVFNEIECRNSKDYLRLAHIYKIKHHFGLACKKEFIKKKRVFSSCLLCGHLGHSTNKCHIGPYCKYISKINSRSCRYNNHQFAQLSFCIHKKDEQPPILKLVQCNQSLCYRATPKMYKIENIDIAKDLKMKKINVYDSIYKVSEADYNKFLSHATNKKNDLIMDILKCKESVSVVNGKVNGREITMLLDTGSTITSITEDLVEQMKLDSWYTNHTLIVTLANTQIEEYLERLCIVTLQVGDVECYETLTVLPKQLYDITLGRNWLKAHMAICNYGLEILRIPGSQPIKMGLVPSFESKPSLHPNL